MSDTEQVVYEIVGDANQINNVLRSLNIQVDELGKKVDIVFKGMGSKEGVANLNQINTAAKQLAATEKQAARDRQTAEKQARQQEKERLAAQREAARAQRTAASEEKARAREIVAITKTFGEQRREINKLVEEFGSFEAVLGDTDEELSDVQQRLQEILSSDPSLFREIQRITAGGTTRLPINQATFYGGPQGGTGDDARRLGFALQRFGVPGTAAFGEIYAVAGAAGLAVGAAIISVKELTDAFKRLGEIAVSVLKEIVVQSVAVAKEVEAAQAQFTAFFQGDEGAAGAALDRLQKLSAQLGENVIQVGRAFLPQVESLDQLEEVVKIAVALARYQPEQGITGARIALQDFFSGQTVSLEKRFEIPKDQIKAFQDALEEGGLQAGLQAITDYLDKTGRGVDALSNTFDVAVGRIRESFRQLGEQAGTPIIKEIEADLADLQELLDQGGIGQELQIIATAFGNVAGKIADFVGDQVIDFIEGLDFEKVSDFGLALEDLADTITDFFELFTIGSGTGNFFELLFEGGTSLVTEADRNIEKFLSGLTNIKESLQAIRDALAESVENAKDFAEKFLPEPVANAITGRLDEVADDIRNSDIGNVLDEVLSSPLTAYSGKAIFGSLINSFVPGANFARQVIDPFLDIFNVVKMFGDESASATEKATQREEERARILETLAEKSDAAANAFLKYSQTLEKLGTVEDSIAELETTIAEARGDFQAEAAQRFNEIEKDYDRARLDNKIANARKLEDIEIKYQEKLADILRQYQYKVDDAAVDLADKEEDIARKHGRDLIELDIETSKARLKAEEDYQEQLRKIRDRFNFLASEAVLANDAKRLREIRRQQAFEEDQAEKDRDKSVEDAEQAAQDKRDKLNRQLQYEIEDAQIANERKLRDLITNLEQQRNEAEIARLNDIEQQRIANQRKEDDLRESNRRAIDDYNDWWRERYQITEDGIAEELQQLADFVRQRDELLGQLSLGGPSGPGGRTGGSGHGAWLEQQLNELRNFALNLAIQAGNTAGEVRDIIWAMTRDELLAYIRDLQRQTGQSGTIPGQRALGGGFLPNQPLLVGENGPELVRFNRTGMVEPLSTIMARPAPFSQFTSITNNSMNLGGFTFPDPRGIPPAYIAMMERIASQVVLEAWAARS